MEEQFVHYELALKLKELGFDEDCLGYYGDPLMGKQERFSLRLDWIPESYPFKDELHCLAPLWQQAGNFLYICSNKKINISINGNDTYKELCEKFEKAISDFRDLQNNKSKR